MHIPIVIVNQRGHVWPFIRCPSDTVNASSELFAVDTRVCKCSRFVSFDECDLALSPPRIGLRTSGDQRGLWMLKAVAIGKVSGQKDT